MAVDNSGKVAIVTGGASGIGEATAHALAETGAHVVILDINLPGGERVAGEIQAKGQSCEAIELDMGDHPKIARVAADVIDRLGGVDFVVNCAVRMDDGDTSVGEIPAELWTVLLATNLIGPAMLCKATIPSMLSRGGGAFVQVASMAGLLGNDTYTCYGAAKAGLMSMSRSIAVQYGKQGIRSNCIAPGLVMTPAGERAFPGEMLEIMKQHHMTPDLGRPEDVAQTILFLLSPAAAFINGHALANDGGFSIMTAFTPSIRALSA